MTRTPDELRLKQLAVEPQTIEPGRAALWAKTDGSVHLKVAGTDNQLYPFPALGPDFQAFTTAGDFTWTKPAGVRWMEVWVIGGGGGGMGGAVGAATAQRLGGNGGAGALFTRSLIPAAAVPDTVDVHVGAGGAGAPSRGTAAGAGTNGSPGDYSFFGQTGIAYGGTGGAPGSAPYRVDTFGLGIGGTSSTVDNGEPTGAVFAGCTGSAPGGGAGATMSTTNAVLANTVQAGGASSYGPAGGAINGGAAPAGRAGVPYVGGGGGGGSTTTRNGGAGRVGGGGGGGAANTTGAAGGAGGNGGDGAVFVISYR